MIQSDFLQTHSTPAESYENDRVRMHVCGIQRAPDFKQNGDAYLIYHNNVERDMSVMGNV